MAWWELSKPFHDYLTRTSAMLQMGYFVADVAYYYGESIPNFAPGSKYIPKSLGSGFDYDDLNKEVLLTSTVSGDGYIQLPGGMKYRLLVLREYKNMSLEILEKLAELLEKGAIILGERPKHVPGLNNYQEREKALLNLADKIWGRKPKDKQKVSIGKGTLFTGYSEREILTSLGIKPDFNYVCNSSLDYIHRSTGAEEIYFVRNTDSTLVRATLDFRVGNKQPYRFDPVSGDISPIAFFKSEHQKTRLPIALEPWGSVFIVFSGHVKKHVVSVEVNGQHILPDQHMDFDITHHGQGEIVFWPQSKGQYRFQFQDGSSAEIDHKNKPLVHVISGEWSVRFPHGWGFDPIQQFDSLIDWTKHPDAAIAMFSGTATYWKTFNLSDDTFINEDQISLDLGILKEVVRVYLNGSEVGSRVFPPYRFEVGHLLVSGANTIAIEVANTWLNQLVGEADKPINLQKTRSNVGNKNGRIWRDYKPLPSGLLGPVSISSRASYIIN
jgi:hypothetical protein